MNSRSLSLSGGTHFVGEAMGWERVGVTSIIHSHPQSSRNTFGTPVNTDPDNKKTTTFSREISPNLVMVDSIEYI